MLIQVNKDSTSWTRLEEQDMLAVFNEAERVLGANMVKVIDINGLDITPRGNTIFP